MAMSTAVLPDVDRSPSTLRAAGGQPDRVAVADATRNLTYAELDRGQRLPRALLAVSRSAETGGLLSSTGAVIAAIRAR
jgi:hypothetical protein